MLGDYFSSFKNINIKNPNLRFKLFLPSTFLFYLPGTDEKKEAFLYEEFICGQLVGKADNYGIHD